MLFFFRFAIMTSRCVRAAVLCLTMLFTACSKDPVGPVRVSRVVVSPASGNVPSGGTLALTASTQDAQGQLLTARVITWSSSDASVATVSNAGMVTALSVTGATALAATITATSEGIAGSATLTVIPIPVSRVVVTPATGSVSSGGMLTLTASTQSSQGQLLTARVINWTSSDITVATVNGAGVVTALSVSGSTARSATITATSEGIAGSATLTVNPAVVSRVVVTPSTSNVPSGGTLTLSASVQDAQGQSLTSRTIAWTSSDITVANVSNGGVLTAASVLSAIAKPVTITATSEGVAGNAALIVIPAVVANVVISPATVTIAEGDSVQLAATALDSGGRVLTGRPVVWASSVVGVASVSSLGRLLATSYDGEAVRQTTVTAASEGKVGSISVSVNIDFTKSSSFFSVVPNAFPDLAREFNAIGGFGGIFTVVRADLNRDGREDLVVHLFRLRTPQELATLPSTGPVPNRMIALLSTPLGTYENKTAELFGTADVDIGGALSRHTAWTDVNGDGFPDWVYAMNREDGRSCVGGGSCPNWGAPLAAAISNGNGTYAMRSFGESAYHHGIGLAKSPTGGFDVFGDDWAFSIIGSTFSPTLPYPSPGLHFTPASTVDGGTSDMLFDAIGSDLKLYTRQGAGAWTQRGAFGFADRRTVPFINWSGDLMTADVVTTRGRELIGGQFPQTCELKSRAGQPKTFIGLYGAGLATAASSAGGVYRQRDLIPWFEVYVVRADASGLTEVPMFTSGGFAVSPGMVFMQCDDLNGDGLGDLAIFPAFQDGKPRVFLNNGAGSLVEVPSSRIPSPPSGNPGLRGLFVDATGDGIPELVYLPSTLNCYANSPQLCTRFAMFRGRRILR